MRDINEIESRLNQERVTQKRLEELYQSQGPFTGKLICDAVVSTLEWVLKIRDDL